MDNITETSSNPYQVLNMDSGDDIICKILKEFADAFVVERPMAIREEPQFNEQFGEVVNQTGLSRWMNFTNDVNFIIPKGKVQSIGNLAPEVTYFYKNICKKMVEAEETQPKSEDEVAERYAQIKKLAEHFASDDDGNTSNVLPFQMPDKTKLH